MTHTSSIAITKQKPDLETFKSVFYRANAKPDTSIKLLEGKKNIELSDIIQLNDRIQEKLNNHNILGAISTVNITFQKNKIQDFGIRQEFINHRRNHINEITETITINYDILISIPQYQNPQRHTMKIRLGKEMSPKDLMQIMFTTDDPNEIREKEANGIVKIDFINQMIATELINQVNDWYSGLSPVQESRIVKTLYHNQSTLVGIIYKTIPLFLLGLLIFLLKEKIIMELNLYTLLITAVSALILQILLQASIGKILTKRIDKTIDKISLMPQFKITNGDKKEQERIKDRNQKTIRKLIGKILAEYSIPTIITYVLEKIIS